MDLINHQHDGRKILATFHKKYPWAEEFAGSVPSSFVEAEMAFTVDSKKCVSSLREFAGLYKNEVTFLALQESRANVYFAILCTQVAAICAEKEKCRVVFSREVEEFMAKIRETESGEPYPSTHSPLLQSHINHEQWTAFEKYVLDDHGGSPTSKALAEYVCGMD